MCVQRWIFSNILSALILSNWHFMEVLNSYIRFICIISLKKVIWWAESGATRVSALSNALWNLFGLNVFLLVLDKWWFIHSLSRPYRWNVYCIYVCCSVSPVKLLNCKTTATATAFYNNDNDNVIVFCCMCC